MKILLVNKFLYPRGGDCIYTLNVGRMLAEAGHTVHYFAMNYPENLPSPDSGLWASEVSFAAPGVREKLRAAARIFGGAGVRESFLRALDTWQPDVVHLNNIHSYLSPVVAALASKRGIRVVWTLHDYKLLCPAYTFRCGSEACERCLHGYGGVLRRRCMKQSLAASLLAWGEAQWWSRKRLAQWTDAFICPSTFMAEKMKQGGFPADKLHVLPNFMGQERAELIRRAPQTVVEPTAYAYIGRLSTEKGVESLLQAASALPFTLYVAGSGPQAAEWKARFASERIHFLGNLASGEVIHLLKRVRFTVMPSACYENCPLSVIESLSAGTPVLGRKTGGIPELLNASPESLLFSTDTELPAAIRQMFTCPLSASARQSLSATSLHRFSAEAYLEQLTQLYI